MTEDEPRDRGSGARRCSATGNCAFAKKNHQILIDAISLDSSSPSSRPQRDGKTHFSYIICAIKKSRPRLHHEARVLPYISPRHGMIKPVLSLCSFLRFSCFLDWVPCRPHQAQFWLFNVLSYDLSRPVSAVGPWPTLAWLSPPIKCAYLLRIRPDAREHGEWHHLRIP
jgi:hypothetical protein